jgi:hypothetical protein
MAGRDPILVCTELRDAGAPPQAVDAAAKAEGLELLERLRILRSLLGLTLAEAKAVTLLTDGPAKPAHPAIDTREHLLQVLTDELGYCDCASEEALHVLVRFLRAAQKRSDCTNNDDEFSSASRELEACLPLEAVGLGDWFVYGLQQRGLVSHNFRVTDAWITSKGRWLLEAIERITRP